MKDWLAWHEAYDDPDSSLARRLEVVRRRLTEALDGVATPARLLSLCAGDGRDVIPVLAARSDAAPVGGVLVEKDPALAARAAAAAAAAGLSVEVRSADAGDPASFDDVLPVEVLLLCGIFGSIDHPAVKAVVDAVPGLLAPGGFVLWTRGGSDPDHRPEVRRWFRDAGLDEVAYDGAPAPYGVGLNRAPAWPPAAPRPCRPVFSRLTTKSRKRVCEAFHKGSGLVPHPRRPSPRADVSGDVDD